MAGGAQAPAATGAPTAPNIGDVNVQEAGEEARANAAAAFGRYATVLTSGPAAPLAPIIKKTLLGATA